MLILRNLLPRLRREDGFTMMLVVGTMAVVVVAVGVVLSDVQGDFKPGRKDEDRKVAYAAAEAGIADYQARLESNPSYWAQCVDANNPSLGQVGTKNFVSMPGLERAVRDRAAADERAHVLLDERRRQHGLERRRVPHPRDRPSPRRRHHAAPDHRHVPAQGLPELHLLHGLRDARPEALLVRDEGRDDDVDHPGRLPDLGDEQLRHDALARARQPHLVGQVRHHEHDRRLLGDPVRPQRQGLRPVPHERPIMVCEQPSFGRNPGDAVEVAGGTPGWRSAGGSCSSSTRPKVNSLPGYSAAINSAVGTWQLASQRDFPPSNASLHDDATANYRFKGPTTIVLNGANMTVTGKREDGTVLTNQSMSIPEGVVYVSDDAAAGSCAGLQPLAPYNGSASGTAAGNPACGDLFISGSYSQNVTFASGNDIVVTGNVSRSSDAWMLGLIPDKFARVYHPVNRSGTSCSDGTGEMQNVTIDAAILALTHSFTVDAYECGNKLGTLTVRGAIAQKYRGPVGTGGTTGTGYTKDYQYDQRLALRSPPRFMNPVQPAWALANRTEQIPVS